MENPLKPIHPRVMENFLSLHALNERVRGMKVHPMTYATVTITGIEARALQWVVTLMEGTNVKFEITER